jgi:hypothetical protein
MSGRIRAIATAPSKRCREKNVERRPLGRRKRSEFRKRLTRGEKRGATAPEVVQKLIDLGFTLIVETDAGDDASFFDDAYAAAGAKIAFADEVWSAADIIFKVRAPAREEMALLKEGAMLVSFIWPAQNPELMQALAARKATALAMDSVPRMSRAQKMDALSSMANIAGYRAVIEAAEHLGASSLVRSPRRARCRRPRCSPSGPSMRASGRAASMAVASATPTSPERKPASKAIVASRDAPHLTPNHDPRPSLHGRWTLEGVSRRGIG